MALCITLKTSDKLKIGESTVEIARVSGKEVRIRIIAPREIPVHRIHLNKPYYGFSRTDRKLRWNNISERFRRVF